jgi:hypothetical protein
MEYLFYGDGLTVVAESNDKDFLIKTMPNDG